MEPAVHRKLTVLSIEPADKYDRGTVFVAAQFGLALRAAARMDTSVTVLDSEAGAERLITGRVERPGRGGFEIKLSLVDAAHNRTIRTVERALPHELASEQNLELEAAKLYTALLAP
jgi:hypothetical protein